MSEDEREDGGGSNADEVGTFGDMGRWGKIILWLLGVVIVAVAGLVLQIEIRNEAVEEIQRASARIEVAALHTEQILTDVVEQQESPEGQAQDESVRRAVTEIFVIKELICDLSAQLEDLGATPSSSAAEACP